MNRWRVELLGKGHLRAGFDCGVNDLNTFLERQAGQNARKDMSRTYVAVPEDSRGVAGYYTLSSGSIRFENLPPDAAKRLPHYPIPTAHLGRLAVDVKFQGRGLGGVLLVNALKRVRDIANDIGIHAVTVDALDKNARSFYEAHGFRSLTDDVHHLYLPLATIRQL